MEEILLQCIGIGCLFLHELSLMYHKLSLIVCFTRISINVPRIVINCLGDIASGCGWLQQPCHASRFFFSNRKDPNNAQTLRMFRMGSVRDCFRWLQQPCHACAGLCAGGHLWLRHTGIRPSQYENPTLHIGVWWGRPFWTLMPHPSFSPNNSPHAPCGHGGQGSAIS